MTSLVELEQEALGCTRCALAQGRTNVVFGVGDPHAELMFVGEGPGEQEDRLGEPFVGRSGKLLDQLMVEELGMGRERCYIANVVLCRPPGNRDPRPEEITACNRFLEGKLELIDPKVVVTLGNFATKLLLGTTERISEVRGRAYPFRRGMLVPTYHPAAALRSSGLVVQMRADLVRAKQFLEGPERPPRAGSTGPERPSRAGSTGPERPSRAGSTGPERPSRAGSTGPVPA